MRGIVVFAILCSTQLLSAQIRIIPQNRLNEANPQALTSTLRFEPREVDLGTIDEMLGVWQGSAEVINHGADTIVITRTKSTCGCLQAELSTRLLAPNEKASVTLRYYPRGHAGRVLQRVFVYTPLSQEQPSAILQLRGIVVASADRSDDYPYTRGVLRLRQEKVRFTGKGGEVQRVACMNGGSTTIRPIADTLLLPKGLRVHFEPALLAPKQEGDMVVEYAPGGDIQNESVLPIYIKGLNLPPRQSRIEVVIER